MGQSEEVYTEALVPLDVVIGDKRVDCHSKFSLPTEMPLGILEDRYLEHVFLFHSLGSFGL